MLERVRKAWDIAAVVLFTTLVASLLFFPHWLGHDYFVYIVEPIGVVVIGSRIARWAWCRYQAAPGLGGFIPRKTPWAP